MEPANIRPDTSAIWEKLIKPTYRAHLFDEVSMPLNITVLSTAKNAWPSKCGIIQMKTTLSINKFWDGLRYENIYTISLWLYRVNTSTNILHNPYVEIALHISNTKI